MTTRRRISALVLALTLALGAAPALAAPARPAVAVRTVHAGWHRALRLMRRGWWCERTSPGRFRCVSSIPPPYLNVVALNMGELVWSLRHDYECAGPPTDGAWDCTPD